MEEKYLDESTQMFYERMSQYFSNWQSTKIEKTKLGDIHAVLKDFQTIGDKVIVDIGEVNFDRFCRVGIDVAEKNIKLTWYEEFDCLEDISSYNVSFNPLKIVMQHYSLYHDMDFIAISATNIRLYSEKKSKILYEEKIGKDILLLYPKGSIYSLNIKKESDLKQCAKRYLLKKF